MDVAVGVVGGALEAAAQRETHSDREGETARRAESAGSGAAAVRWLRPRVEFDSACLSVAAAGLQPEPEPVHPLEVRWARQVEQRFQQLAVLFGERRVRSVPEVEWMDTSVAVFVEAAASMGEARKRFYEGMVAVQAPPVEQIFATPPLHLGRGFADSTALGQQMRVSSQRYYESVMGRSHQQIQRESQGERVDSKHAVLDAAAPKRRVSQTSSEDGSEGENPVVAVSSDDGRAQTTDGVAATRQANVRLSGDDESRARTSEGIARSDSLPYGSSEQENVAELREALRQARVHLRQSLPSEEYGADCESVGEDGAAREETRIVGFATPDPGFADVEGSRHPRTISPSWDSCGPGTVLRSFPVQDAASLGFESPAGAQSKSASSDIVPQLSPSVGRRTRPSRSQYSRVVTAAAEEADKMLATAVQEAGRLELAGDVAGARAAATTVEVARQHAEEAHKLCNEVEKAEAQLMFRVAVVEAVSLQDQVHSPHVCGDNFIPQGSTKELDGVDAPLILSDGRTLSVQVHKNAQGEQSTQIVLTQTSAEASSATFHGRGDGSPGLSGTELGPARTVCAPSDSGTRRIEASASELAQGAKVRVLNAYPMADCVPVVAATAAHPRAIRTAVTVDEESKSASHAFGSKEHIGALLSALHTEEPTEIGSPGSPGSSGVSSAVVHRQRTEAKMKRQQLVREMLELAVAEQAKKERRKARLTIPGGRFLPSDTTVSAEPSPAEASPVQLQAGLWARAQELIGERQKGQRVARALIESFEPLSATASFRSDGTAATEAGMHESANDVKTSSATNIIIAATEAWHSHGDGLEYAAVDIPESACATEAELPGDQLTVASSSIDCTHAPKIEVGDLPMHIPSDSRVIRGTSSSPGPQAVVETVARDQILQKRAQVEVQEMLARIREKTKRQTTGVKSARRRDSTLGVHSVVVPDSAWPRERQCITRATEAGAALDCESARPSFAVRQKARGQVQEVLTKIKRQAQLHASPAKRSHSGQLQDVWGTGLREASRSGPDRGHSEACPTSGWLSAISSAEGVRTAARKTRKSQHNLDDASDTRVDPIEAAVLQPTLAEPRAIQQFETQQDILPVFLPSGPIEGSSIDTGPAEHHSTDADTLTHDNLAHQSESVNVALRQPSAFASVRATCDAFSGQQRPKDSLVDGQYATTTSHTSKPNLRQRGLCTHESDEERSTEADSTDETVIPTQRRHSPTAFVAQSLPSGSSALPAAGVETVLQKTARPLTPQAHVAQQRTQVALDASRSGSSDVLSAKSAYVQRPVAEHVGGGTCSEEVGLRLADNGRATVVSASPEELRGHIFDGNASSEAVRNGVASAGVSADVVEDEAVCEINVSLQELAQDQALTGEAQQTLLQTIAQAAHTDASNVHVLGSPGASDADSHTRSCLTVCISEPVAEEPDDCEDHGVTAVKTIAHIEQAIADGSMTTMLKHCGVQSLSQAHVGVVFRRGEKSSPLIEAHTEQVRQISATRDNRRLTEDGIVVGVPIIGAVVKSSDTNEGAVDHCKVVGGIPLTPPRHTKRRKETFLDSTLHEVPKQMLYAKPPAALHESTMHLDEAGEAPSPGSPEREEFLKHRARVEMQQMLAQIEERQCSNSRTHRNSGGTRRRLVNQPLAPLADVPNLRCDPLAIHEVSRHQTDTMTMGFKADHSNTTGDALRSGASESKDVDTSQQLQLDLHSSAQMASREPTPSPPELSRAEGTCPGEMAPRKSTKEAVSAILAQLHDDKFDLSKWTGDMRDLDVSGVDDVVACSADADADTQQLSARSVTSADSNDELQPTPEESVGDSKREATNDISEAPQASEEATLLNILSDGQLCWRILRSVAWQQLRVLQRISTEFRAACKVVLALRPQAICVGGANRGIALRSAVAYDNVSNEWSMLASMAVGRINSAVCSLVPGAGVLVAGGYNGKGMEASAERFDIDSGRWIATAPMPVEKSGCRGVLLQEAGIALVLGGYDQNHQTLARVDGYDWQEDAWNATQFPPMLTARYDCAACSLPHNRVVVAGGTDSSQSWLQSAEVYDHALRKWSFLPSLGVQRDRCAAVGLSLGTGAATVLVLGGSSHPPSDEASLSENGAGKRSSSPLAPGIVDLSTCEALSIPLGEAQLDRANWIVAPQLKTPRCSFGAVAVGGVVLAIGGEASGTVERLSVAGRGGGWEEVAKLPHPRIGGGAAACPLAAPPHHADTPKNRLG